MSKGTRDSRLKSKITTSEDIPVFSDAQIQTFNSDYVDSLDDVSAVLDETNRFPIGLFKSVKDNKK